LREHYVKILAKMRTALEAAAEAVADERKFSELLNAAGIQSGSLLPRCPLRIGGILEDAIMTWALEVAREYPKNK